MFEEEYIVYPQTTLVNTSVPDMELDAYQNGKIEKVRLSDYKGKWMILFFYPADFTFVCPTELEEMAELYPKFQELNAEVLSISTDTAYVHKAWHDQSPSIGKVDYPMVADPTGELCRSMGTYIEEEGLSYRASILVNPDGIIKAYEMHDNSIGRSATELLRKLQAAQFVSNNPAQVCPAKWQPGSDTLTPGVDLIGKI